MKLKVLKQIFVICDRSSGTAGEITGTPSGVSNTTGR